MREFHHGKPAWTGIAGESPMGESSHREPEFHDEAHMGQTTVVESPTQGTLHQLFPIEIP